MNKQNNFIFTILLSAITSLIISYISFNSLYKENKQQVQTVEKVEHTVKSNDDKSIQEIVKTVQDSVVEINIKENAISFWGEEIQQEGAGSGVIISEDGYIVTNNHVVENADEVEVTLRNQEKYNAKIIGRDLKSDLAVIKIEENNLTYATFADSDTILVGDSAIAIGNPLGKLGGTVTSGIISALDREIIIENQPMNLLQTNAEVNPGNSGGGLFNSKAELIGIINAKSSSSLKTIEGIGFAIPSNEAKKIVDDIIENGYVTSRATLGINAVEITKDSPYYTKGVYISNVVKNSAAEKAGLIKEDKIVSIDGVDINTYSELSRIIQKHNPNDKITLVIQRQKDTLKIDVTLSNSIKE